MCKTLSKRYSRLSGGWEKKCFSIFLQIFLNQDIAFIFSPLLGSWRNSQIFLRFLFIQKKSHQLTQITRREHMYCTLYWSYIQRDVSLWKSSQISHVSHIRYCACWLSNKLWLYFVSLLLFFHLWKCIFRRWAGNDEQLGYVHKCHHITDQVFARLLQTHLWIL